MLTIKGSLFIQCVFLILQFNSACRSNNVDISRILMTFFLVKEEINLIKLVTGVRKCNVVRSQRIGKDLGFVFRLDNSVLKETINKLKENKFIKYVIGI